MTDANKANKAAKAVLSAFVWSETSEGDGFWRYVYLRLLQIADDGKLKVSRKKQANRKTK